MYGGAAGERAQQSKAREAMRDRGANEATRVVPACRPGSATSRQREGYDDAEKVRPGGDAGLVRPTYPELGVGGNEARS